MTRDELAAVLDTHRQAYQLLLWLDRRASRDANVFSPETVADLQHAPSCQDWLGRNRNWIPAEIFPAEDRLGQFACLLSSFFETSFHVDRLEFGGKVLEARLSRGVDAPAAKRSQGRVPRLMMIHALRRLANDEHLPIDQQMAARLVARHGIRKEVLAWTYAVELVRRTLQRGKGLVVHKIWRAMDAETRRSLTIEVVWEARQRLLDVIREVRVGEAAE